MKELAKRWSRTSPWAPSSWILMDSTLGWNWALIRRSNDDTEWELRVWKVNKNCNKIFGVWEWVTNIKSLRAAKAAGRILAAKAINF
jgi:hypothetical protein